MKRLLAAIVAVLAMLISACGSGGSNASDSGTSGTDNRAADTSATFRYATSGGATSFDPHKTKSSSDVIVLDYVYDRLVHRNADGEPIPGLAEKWEIAPDLRSLTLHLRKATFSDGSAIDAAAVVANIERAKEKDSITAPMLASVAKAEAKDDSTVVLTLAKPDASVLLSLSDLAGMIVNPKAFGDPAKLALEPQGSGRFTLASSDPGSKYVFAARDGYWDKDAVKVKTIEFTVQTNPQTSINGLQSGQFDCALVSPAMVAQTKKMPDLVTKARPVQTNNVLYFNRTKGELAKQKVRQAISIAIDRDAIVTGAMEGEGATTNQLFPEGYFAHSDSITTPKRDIAKAKQLLAEAGLPNGFSFTTLTLTIPQFTTIAEIIQANLKEIGVDMKIKPMAPADMGVAFIKGDGDAVITAWLGRADPTLLMNSYFDAASPQNPSHESMPGFAEALAAADAKADHAERGKAFDAVNQIIAEQVPVVPLAFNVVGAACSKNVVGYQPSILIDEFRGVGLAK